MILPGRQLRAFGGLGILSFAILASLSTCWARARATPGVVAPAGTEQAVNSVAPKVALLLPSQLAPEPRKPIILAHAIVVRTSPAQGGVAEGAISKVEVWYDAGIRDAFVALAVVSASGERVDKHDAAIDSADPAHVSVSVNQLSPGKYTARYRALSADGHMVSGSWEFEVRP